MYCQYFKRILDFCLAALFILLLSPVYMALYILIRLRLGAPVLYSQLRPGLHGAPFKIYKFRTMTAHCDHQGQLLSDEQRLTRFGKILRSLSVDELPELWNVLKGEMSLIGPRPLLMDYLPFYSEQQRHRHDLRPGITGWAQVNGRNRLSWSDKFNLDLWYVKHCSFSLDLKIIFLTLFKIVKREGISAEGQATMTRFDLEAKLGEPK